MNDENLEIGGRIRDIRIDNNLTQADMAEKIDVNRNKINDWEAGRSAIKINDLIKISKVFNVSCDKILRDVRTEFIQVHDLSGLSDLAIEQLASSNKKNNDGFSNNIGTVLSYLLESEKFFEFLLAYNNFEKARAASKKRKLIYEMRKRNLAWEDKTSEEYENREYKRQELEKWAHENGFYNLPPADAESYYIQKMAYTIISAIEDRLKKIEQNEEMSREKIIKELTKKAKKDEKEVEKR